CVLKTGCVMKALVRAKRSSKRSSTSSASPPASGAGSADLAPAGTALGTGQRAWAAFSHRGLSQARWWAALSPLLSESAKATYVYDDPRNLPQLDLTGSLRLAAKTPSDPHFTAAVVVPTDRGAFHLDLERHTRHSPWLLYAIVFPRSVS
ncbi:MAG: hypothetical protein JWR42_1059, partial [Marmoricola sp.]|nr:hypothetical protein [Marmoricola sp.]